MLQIGSLLNHANRSDQIVQFFSKLHAAVIRRNPNHMHASVLPFSSQPPCYFLLFSNNRSQICLATMGAACVSKGNVEQAIKYQQKSISILSACTSANHPDVARANLSLGKVLHRRSSVHSTPDTRDTRLYLRTFSPVRSSESLFSLTLK